MANPFQNSFTQGLSKKFSGLNSFVNSVTPKQQNQSIAPKAVTPTVNMSTVKGPVAATPVVSSNNSATSPKPTVVSNTPVAKPSVSPAAKSYIETVHNPTQEQTMNTWATQNNLNKNTDGSYSALTAQPTPTVTANTKARDEYITAYRAYQDAQRQNAEVQDSKKRYNDFVAEQAKAIAGKEGQGRGIPLSIVRGEQEKLLRQTQPEALRLQGEIGIAQEGQKALVDTAKSEVDLQEKLLGDEKPVEIGGVLYARQSDGSYKPLTEKEKSMSDTYGTGIIGEYNFAKSQGYAGSFEQYQNEDANRKKSIAKAGVSPTGISTPGVLSPLAQAVQSGIISLDKVPADLRAGVASELATSGIPSQRIATIDSNIDVVNALLNNPALGAISGIQAPTAIIPGTNAQLARNQYNQLKGILSLENREKLKGSGAISDFEFRILAEAATALGRNLSDAAFLEQLQKTKEIFEKAKARHQAGSGQITPPQSNSGITPSGLKYTIE